MSIDKLNNQAVYISEQQFEKMRGEVKAAGLGSIYCGGLGMVFILVLYILNIANIISVDNVKLFVNIFFMLVYIIIGELIFKLKYRQTFWLIMFLIAFSGFMIFTFQILPGVSLWIFIFMIAWLFRGAKSMYALGKIKEFKNTLV